MVRSARLTEDARCETWGSEDLRSLWLADLNGDGRADLCRENQDGLFCGLSDGRRFTQPTNWLARVDRPGWSARGRRSPIALGDINGDGHADLCIVAEDGVHTAAWLPNRGCQPRIPCRMNRVVVAQDPADACELPPELNYACPWRNLCCRCPVTGREPK